MSQELNFVGKTIFTSSAQAILLTAINTYTKSSISPKSAAITAIATGVIGSFARLNADNKNERKDGVRSIVITSILIPGALVALKKASIFQATTLGVLNLLSALPFLYLVPIKE